MGKDTTCPYVLLPNCRVDIQLPARTDVRSSERIEAAIKTMDGLYSKKSQELADLFRWVLGQEQDTWTDEDLGLREKK